MTLEPRPATNEVYEVTWPTELKMSPRLQRILEAEELLATERGDGYLALAEAGDAATLADLMAKAPTGFEHSCCDSAENPNDRWEYIRSNWRFDAEMTAALAAALRSTPQRFDSGNRSGLNWTVVHDCEIWTVRVSDEGEWTAFLPWESDGECATEEILDEILGR